MARRSRRVHHHHRQRKDRCSLCLSKTGSDSAGFETKSICLEGFGNGHVFWKRRGGGLSRHQEERQRETHREFGTCLFLVSQVMTENPEFCDDLRILWCSWKRKDFLLEVCIL
jgi:hypothetical protein